MTAENKPNYNAEQQNSVIFFFLSKLVFSFGNFSNSP